MTSRPSFASGNTPAAAGTCWVDVREDQLAFDVLPQPLRRALCEDAEDLSAGLVLMAWRRGEADGVEPDRRTRCILAAMGVAGDRLETLIGTRS